MNIYLLTNFRILPYLSILFELIRNRKKDQLVILSRESLNSFDYGEYLPYWNKKLKLFFLRILYRVLIIDSIQHIKQGEIDSTGIISSLMSITNDSLADEFKYPHLYQMLYKSAIGAYSVQLYLEKLKNIYELFLFNGRGSSQFQIALFASRNNVKVSYFEYGYSSIKGYKLFPYSPHSLLKIGLDLINIFKCQSEPFVLSLEQKKIANKIISEKLGNSFTFNLEHSKLSFDIVVFLGSDHEYTGISREISGISFRGNLELCKYAFDKYGHSSSIAVRAHPNQRNDCSAFITNKKIRDYCQLRNIVFFDYDSKISSHSLIRNSKIVVTEYSSICYDAIYLEREVDIFGEHDLKIILCKMPNEIISLGPKEVKFYVAYLKYLEEYLYFHPFNFFFKFFCLFFTIIERRYTLKSELIK
jgi:hypothetical protein